ncbi:MAG: NADP-dependent isocitrate dehydrogenase [Oscillatoriales cyanobacterium]|nr:MAG: NADP-dependent isocitrate dehydrogenase [Oscillatoriales cyanobacterium]
MYEKIVAPTTGSKITFKDGSPIVPNDPIIPFIRGDGTGVDLWPASQKVMDTAVEKAYGGQRKINWFKIYVGDEACDVYGTYQYLPQDSLDAIKEYGVAIKGPLTTPVGGGIRSLNVALRQIFDLYACVRPCKYYDGTPSLHKTPELLDVIIYRENTEDIYLGIEWKQGSEIGNKLIEYLNNELIPATPEHGKKQIRLDSAIGIKPISKSGSQRLVRRAITHALRLPKDKQQVTLVHKGNIMKYTEGGFRDWGYELATTEFRADCVTERESWILGNKEHNSEISLEENARQMNLNGDYLSDAAAAIVGGLGMGPGANIGDECAVFEATHGTAPKHAGLDRVNPGSLILSGVMMLEYMGWQEAADLIKKGLGAAISNGEVTYDLARLMEPPVPELKCSEFAEAIIKHFAD